MGVVYGKKESNSGRQETVAAPVSAARTSLSISASSDWLSETDVDLSPQPRPKQAIMALIGEDGHHKTSFCLRELPKPLAFFSFDGRAENEIQLAYERGDKIYPVYIPPPSAASGMKPSKAKEYGFEIISLVQRNLEKFSSASLNNLPGAPKSIVFDTASEFNLWCDLAYRGTTNPMEQKSIDDDGKQEKKFGNPANDINRVFWDIFGRVRWSPPVAGNKATGSFAHLVLICRQKEIWIDNAPTGQFAIDGDKVISRGSDLVVRIALQKEMQKISKEGQPPKYKATGRLSKDYELTMVKAVNLMEMNKLYQPEMWKKDEAAAGNPFVYLCMKNHKNSTREDWT